MTKQNRQNERTVRVVVTVTVSADDPRTTADFAALIEDACFRAADAGSEDWEGTTATVTAS